MAIDIKDIIMHLRQYTLGVDNVENYYDECKTEDEKLALLEKCKQLIVNGWDEKLSAESKESFFSTLKPIFIDPTKKGGFFFMKKEVGPEANDVISYFGRYCIFRIIIDMYKSGKISCSENAKTWCIQTNNLLKQQLQKLILTERIMKYGNIEVHNFLELYTVMTNDFVHKVNDLKKTLLLITVIAIAYLYVNNSKNITTEKKLVCNAIFVFLCLLLKNIRFSDNRYRLEAVSRSPTQTNVSDAVKQQNESMKKFIHIDDNEIEAIFSKNQLIQFEKKL